MISKMCYGLVRRGPDGVEFFDMGEGELNIHATLEGAKRNAKYDNAGYGDDEIYHCPEYFKDNPVVRIAKFIVNEIPTDEDMTIPSIPDDW